MKRIIFGCIACVLCASLCACENEKKTVPISEIQEVNNEGKENREIKEIKDNSQIKESGFSTIIYNGKDISLGDRYEEVKEIFGDETKPTETITACGPGQTSDVYIHFFDNFEVHVDNKGDIIQFEIRNSNISLKTGAHVGQDYNEAKSSTESEPEFEFEGYVSYRFSDCMASIEYDENNTVSKISVESVVEE